MIPGPKRVAIHQAGHAVVQTIVGRNRFAVTRVSVDGPCGEMWQDQPARGEALLDREVFLGLYEFGLVTLAGIAAEERYLAEEPPEVDPVVALSDLASWQEQALNLLQEEARVQLVSLNVMAKLDEWLAESAIWQVVEHLAAELLVQGTIQGELLQQILSPLAGGKESSS